MSNIFPKWTNDAPKKIILGLVILGGLLTAAVTYYCTPKYLRVGYEPIQPVAFSHALHAGQLGLDCRYCHTYVDKSPHANIPASSTCMNCHTQIKRESPQLAPIRESYASGQPVPWVRIHKAPDYVYFNHAAHVNRGVSCVECHGKINEMEVVRHEKPFSMDFCLNCHRNPEEFLRPLDKVYDLDWHSQNAKEQVKMGERFVHDWKVNPPESCSGCHR